MNERIMLRVCMTLCVGLIVFAAAQAVWWAAGRPIGPSVLLVTVVGAVSSATGLAVAYSRGWRWNRNR